ncbi:MAG: sodium:solute symporter family protein [Bacteroidota bacterium]
MLLVFISLYLLLTILIGVISSRWIKSSRDYVLAGRRLPLVLAASALFATWFGSETVLGASSEFAEHGLLGVIEDPFGAALCLLLVGLLVARPLYRMNILTFCDFYRDRFGPKVELLSSLCMVPSYFGWIAAQLVALGILFQTVAGIPTLAGIWIGTGVVLIYTYIGGMWAISITDFIQTIVIIAGLLFLAIDLGNSAGGFKTVIANTPDGFFRTVPQPNFIDSVHYFAAWITIGLGSIPQQDVFQRVMAARSEKIAVQASYLGAGMYFTVGLIPLFIGLCTVQVYPSLLTSVSDTQLMLPTVVLQHTGTGLQILFFGALLSAIMSTTSGAILAPATILAENIIKPRWRIQNDTQLLRVLRGSVIAVAVASTVMASLKTNIYDLVALSSVLSLVSLFVPLMAGLYWKKANELSALLSISLGMLGWLIFEYLVDSEIPSLLWGLGASISGLLIGISSRGKSPTK